MIQFAGVDFNASRARAVCGAAGSASRPVALDGERGNELAVALSLEGRRIEVGAAGLELCRRFPHLACTNFLPQLGTDREWRAGRHRVNAAAALTHVLKRMQPALSNMAGLGLTVPAYLSGTQRALLADLCKQAKLPLLGWMAGPLAAAWAARAARSWHGPTVTLDVDDHALMWSVIDVPANATAPARLLTEHAYPSLGLCLWKARMIDGIADRCIRQSRRDPRASGLTEQLLHDQLEAAVETCARGRLVELVIQAENWYQDLVLRPGEIERYCAPLVQRAVQSFARLAGKLASPPQLLIATAPAARLPGLLRALPDQAGARLRFLVLDPDALAHAAAEAAYRWHDGVLPRGALDRTVQLPPGRRPLSPGPRLPAPSQQTRLPPRGARLLRTDDDDFSVTIDD